MQAKENGKRKCTEKKTTKKMKRRTTTSETEKKRINTEQVFETEDLTMSR